MPAFEIPASFITDGARAWLIQTREAHVLHIFEPVCNLINEYREILSIVTPQIGKGPFNLVTRKDICFSDYLDLESKVSVSPAQLRLGNLTVHAAKASNWDPCPDWEKLHARKGDIDHQLTQLPITNYLYPCGLDTRFAKSAQSSSSSPASESLISDLCSSLVIADLGSSLRAAQKLAGLGLGLTPAGDDYIVGAIYAAWIIHPREVARVLAQEVAKTAAPLTTSLSAAWLRSAGRGEAGLVWHEFFEALLSQTDESPDLQEAIKGILAIGETSGADALAGFTSVFASWKKEFLSE